MRKKILAVFLCLFSALIFCGCGSVSYILQVSSSGVVTQACVIIVSKKDIQDAGKTITNFRNNVEYVGNTVVSNSINSFKNSHELTDEVETYGGEKVPFSTVMTYTLSNIELYFGGPKYEWSGLDSDSDTLTCTISLKFLTISAYYYFHDIYPDTPEDESNKTIEDHAFYVKKITESKSPFYDLANDDDIVQYFINYFGEDKFTLSDMKYSFCYSTTDEKLYSDANQIYASSNGNIVHQWDYTAADLAQENGGLFHTYTIKIKAYMWYMLAIIISLSVALVLIIYVKIKERKEKLLKIENNQQVDSTDEISE